MKILIVDDENIIRFNLQAYLEDEGFEVFLVESGEAGLKLLQSQSIDVAIVDMRLPKMNGNDFIAQAFENWSHIKFLIHTGSSEYVLPESLMKLGMSPKDVIYKPINDMKKLVSKFKI